MNASTTTNDGVLLRFDDPASDKAVILEDDGRVAYAYLLAGEKIVADVWLYNVAEAPAEPDWRAPEKMPFLNPKAYCRADVTLTRLEATQVRCVWNPDGAEIMLDGALAARLTIGQKPGWSRLAAKSGPLAWPLPGVT
jgi:hypothetical protein